MIMDMENGVLIDQKLNVELMGENNLPMVR